MSIVRIAWRNVGRSKRRSILTALAIAFAVVVLMSMMAIQRGSYADMIYNTVHVHTGHLQVQQAGYWPEMDIACKLSGYERILAAVTNLPHVVAAAPRVNAPALVSKGQRTFGTMLYGISPRHEAAASTLREIVTSGAYLEDDDRDGALVGAVLASNLGVAPGDEVVFLGQGADGSIAAGRLVVRGIVSFGVADMDRMAMAANLGAVQEAYSMHGAVSEVAVLLDHDRYRPEVEQTLRDDLARQGERQAAVLGWPRLLPGIEQTIKLDWSSGLILYGVLVLVVGFGIANTFLMAYMERIHEFGVMLALGMRPATLSLLVYAESAILSLLGLVAGLAAGVPLVLYFQVHGIEFGMSEDVLSQYGMSPVIHPLLTPLVLQWTVAIVMGMALLFAIYPALKAARLRPVEALRHT